MGERTTESNSIPGKSLPHANELSSSLGASHFWSHFTAAPVLTLSFYVNLRLEGGGGWRIFWLSRLLFRRLFPMENNDCRRFSSRVRVMDALCPLNQTLLGSPRALVTLECI